MNRPQPAEYAPYQKTYIDKVPDGDVLDILARQQDTLAQYFGDFPDERADFAYAEGKWTVKQVLGHICDTERIFAYRALRIARGDQTPLPGFDQDPYVEAATFTARTLADLAGEFIIVRENTLLLFRNLKDAQWNNLGTASGNPLSVRSCAYVIAGHTLHHLQILNERYR